jgi:formylglycine-generating enzyme required for sulfatase activity
LVLILSLSPLSVGAREPGAVAGMIRIPASEFTLGCSPRDGACVDDATRFAALDVPLRRIHLPDFWIDRKEVTREEYGRCVADSACTPIDGKPWNGIAEPDLPNLPASGVDWDQAAAFCEWRGARLPTEAEWEKAARGPEGARYPWGDDEPACGQANVRIREEGCASSRQVEPVDRHPLDVSPYGVLGMAGNVQEWTSDWLSPDYSAVSTQEPDARFPRYKIVRGGYFDMSPRRVSWRSFAPKTVRSVGRIGFRCASSEDLYSFGGMPVAAPRTAYAGTAAGKFASPNTSRISRFVSK